MFKQICKILVLILIYNNLYSVTCKNINDKLKYIKSDLNKILIIYYSNEKIIIFENLQTYAYAFIENINAFVYYIECNPQENRLYFKNIDNTDVEYYLPLNTSMGVYLKKEFNTKKYIDFERSVIADSNFDKPDMLKLYYINDQFNTLIGKQYNTTEDKIMELISLQNNYYNLRVINPSTEIPIDNLDNMAVSGYLPSAAKEYTGQHEKQDIDIDQLEEHQDGRGKKRIRIDGEIAEQNERQGVKKLRLNDACGSGASSSTTESAENHILENSKESYLSAKSKLSPVVNDFLIKSNLFKNEYYILEETRKIQDIVSNPQDKIINLNIIIENLGIGESLVLVKKEFATDPYNDNPRIAVLSITKNEDKIYNVQLFKYDRIWGFYEIENDSGNVILGYRGDSYGIQRYFISYNGKHYIIEDYYIIGEINKKIHECSSVDKSGNNLEYNSMQKLLQAVFKEGKYYNEDVNKITNIDKRRQYLNDNIATVKHKETFVFVYNEYLNNSEKTKANTKRRLPGLILESLHFNQYGQISTFKIKYIENGFYSSHFSIDYKYDKKISFVTASNHHLLLRVRDNSGKIFFQLDLNNYILIREKLDEIIPLKPTIPFP